MVLPVVLHCSLTKEPGDTFSGCSGAFDHIQGDESTWKIVESPKFYVLINEVTGRPCSPGRLLCL